MMFKNISLYKHACAGAVLLFCIICSACAGPGYVSVLSPTTEPSATPVLTPAAYTQSPEPTFDEALFLAASGPAGITALEFAEEYPELECDTVQFGVITQITESSVTFNEAVWVTGDELPADYAGTYDVRETGETVTFALDDDCRYWILWHAHWIYPARISAADFVSYCDEQSWPVYWFYSVDGHLLMITEQYTA